MAVNERRCRTAEKAVKMNADRSQWAVKNKITVSRESRESRDVSISLFLDREKTPPPVRPPVLTWSVYLLNQTF